MTIQIYNTLSHKKEPFETIEPNQVRMYVCGPTVYSQAHIGHAMSALVFDIIRRYLEWRGYQVTHAMNFTDVDDKIINRANREGVDPFQLAEGYILDFRRNLDELNILPASINPRATQEIGEILRIIQGLDRQRLCLSRRKWGRIFPRPARRRLWQAVGAQDRGYASRSADRSGRVKRTSHGFCAVESCQARRALLG